MSTKKNILCDYIKANRRATREAEIENHNRPVNFCRVHKSKKVYDRKRMKADDKRHLPSSFPRGLRAFGVGVRKPGIKAAPGPDGRGLQ